MGKMKVHALLLLVLVLAIAALMSILHKMGKYTELYSLPKQRHSAIRLPSLVPVNDTRDTEKLPKLVSNEHNVVGNFCVVGKPCEFPDIVDLRILVLTFIRTQSLVKLLTSLTDLILDGDSASLEIFIDRMGNGKIHNATFQAAVNFKWKLGPTRIHLRQSHAGIQGQWADSWRPLEGTKEIALILEDDLYVSKYAYRWLKAVHGTYGHSPDIQGFTLQSENLRTFDIGNERSFAGPPMDTVFLYQALGTWGFSPHPVTWRKFQDWFHTAQNNKTFHPYVNGMVITQWFRNAEKHGNGKTIFSVWHIYYSYVNKLYCVYNNLNQYLKTSTACLSVNRMENGLHYSGKTTDNKGNLLNMWDAEYVRFPKFTSIYNYSGLVFNKI